MHGYPFGLGSSGYMKPIGGRSLALIPGVLATHSSIFMRVFMEIGARATAIKLDSPDEGIVVFAPIPWGPEMQGFLQVLEPGKALSDINVKYLVAPDCEHHMALKSWKEQFPNAKILGPEPLNERKKAEGIALDYAFREQHGSRLLTGESLVAETSLPLPSDLTREFDFVYFPAVVNKELVLLHKPTRTLLSADLFFNLPAYQQYKGSGINPTSGLSFVTRFLGMDSWLQRKVLGTAIKPKDAVAINALYNWNFDRLIMCHGDVLEGEESRSKFAKLFGAHLKAKV